MTAQLNSLNGYLYRNVFGRELRVSTDDNANITLTDVELDALDVTLTPAEFIDAVSRRYYTAVKLDREDK